MSRRGIEEGNQRFCMDFPAGEEREIGEYAVSARRSGDFRTVWKSLQRKESIDLELPLRRSTPS
jgi:hypothetical protein